MTRAQTPKVEDSNFVVVNDPVANCGNSYIIANGSENTRLWTYFDQQGQPVRVVFHGRYKGKLTNSVTGASILDSPSVANISVNLITGTETHAGAFWTVTTPGGGTVLIEAGRLVFNGEGPPVFIAGPHRAIEDSLNILCNALR
jgi:hypothetical protein